MIGALEEERKEGREGGRGTAPRLIMVEFEESLTDSLMNSSGVDLAIIHVANAAARARAFLQEAVIKARDRFAQRIE